MRSSRRWRDGLPEAITWFGALDHATGGRVEAETVPMRAYVTSSDDAREAPCERATTSRHVVWASSRLAAHERREGLCARTASRRRSRGGARMKAGDACASLQAPRLLRWQRSRHRVAQWSPSFRRGRAKQHAHGQSRRFRYSEVAPRRIDPASSAGPLCRLGRFRVRDRGN